MYHTVTTIAQMVPLHYAVRVQSMWLPAKYHPIVEDNSSGVKSISLQVCPSDPDCLGACGCGWLYTRVLAKTVRLKKKKSV